MRSGPPANSAAHVAGRLLARISPWWRRCKACGAVMGDDAGDLCPPCDLELEPRTRGYCPDCAELMADPNEPPTLCLDCRVNPKPWAGIGFYGKYQGMLGELVVAYKFSGALGYGGLLQELLWRGYEKHRPGLACDMIVPVPLHRKRLASRGFNQALELSRHLSRKTGKPLAPDALQRIRHTRAQSLLKGRQRIENVKGAFVADPDSVRGKSVLLVDDIMTTGATLDTCAGALKKAKAHEVKVLVLARA